MKIFYSRIVLILILIIILVLLAIFIAKRKKDKGKPFNYKLFFILGLIWLPLGFALRNPGFWAPGILFTIIGLVNRDKWREESWSELMPSEKNIRIILIIILGLLLLAGIAFFIHFANRPPLK